MFRSLKSLCTISFSKSLNKKFPLYNRRLFHEEFSSPKPLQKDDQEQQNKLSGAVKTKYKVFKDEESTIIYDVEEEKQRLQQQEIDNMNESDKYIDISLERGIHGVYDIEDLVDILRKENAINIFVCSVAKHIKYVDYMCVVTGRSYRHMSAIAEYVRRIYKSKRHKDDLIPKVEGINSKDWMAIDLGNIALHIFSPEARKIYDLESLWSIGSEYDPECNKPKDPLIELLEKNSIYLNDLKPKEVQ